MSARSIIGAGIVGFVVLAVLTIVLTSNRIVDDLGARSAADLEAAGLNFASVSFSGRDATLTGSAPDAASASKAVEVVQGVWGVRAVIDEIDKP